MVGAEFPTHFCVQAKYLKIIVHHLLLCQMASHQCDNTIQPQSVNLTNNHATKRPCTEKKKLHPHQNVFNERKWILSKCTRRNRFGSIRNEN